MRNVSVSLALFAATFVAIGVVGLVRGDFAPVWEPVPKAVPMREALVYASAIISLACGVGLLWMRTAASASRVLLISLVLWFLLFRFPVLWRAPTVIVAWESCAETAVIIAAAWVATGASGTRLARVLFGLALIAFGLSHFAYLKQTASLVPAWLPAHAAWAYFTGCAYIAAGVAVIVGVLAGLAAALAAVQMGCFTLLVWVPTLARGARNASDLSEGIISWALTVAAWVVADSYRRYRAALILRQPAALGQEVVSRSDYDPTPRR